MVFKIFGFEKCRPRIEITLTHLYHFQDEIARNIFKQCPKSKIYVSIDQIETGSHFNGKNGELDLIWLHSICQFDPLFVNDEKFWNKRKLDKSFKEIHHKMQMKNGRRDLTLFFPHTHFSKLKKLCWDVVSCERWIYFSSQSEVPLWEESMLRPKWNMHTWGLGISNTQINFPSL